MRDKGSNGNSGGETTGGVAADRAVDGRVRPKPGASAASSNSDDTVTTHVTVWPGSGSGVVPGGPGARETDDSPQKYQLRDDKRRVAFTGSCIASVSSKRPGVQRWTQVSIFRTSGAGRYIVERVGVSVVAHRVDCPQVATKKPYGLDSLMPDEAAPAERQACPVCKPDVAEFMKTDPASLTFEQDKHRTQIWEDAREMVDSLYTARTSPGQRALSGLMLWVLDEASKVDPVIAAVYNRVVEIG